MRRALALACALLALAVPPSPAVADGFSARSAFMRRFGAGSNSQASSIALSDVIGIAGWLRGRGPGAAGGSDAFLRIPTGINTARTVRFGTAAADRATGVAGYGSRIVVGGWTAGSFGARRNAGGRDGFIRMFGRSGHEVRWTRSFGTAADDVVTGVHLRDHVIVVTGRTAGVFAGEVGSGGTDAFVTAFSGAGTHLWTRQFGSAGDDASTGVAAEAWGPVVITGTTTGGLPGADAANAGGVDGFVATVDLLDGEMSDIHQFGTAGDDSSAGVDVLRGFDDRIIVAGTTQGVFQGEQDLGGSDGFVASFADPGGLDYVVQFGTELDDRIEAVSVDASFVYAAGSTAGVFPGAGAHGGLDAFVTEIDSSGTVVWTDQFGGAQDDVPTGITNHRFGAVNQHAYVAGSTDHASFWGDRTVPDDARAKANLLAALAVAQGWADANGGSFDELTPVTATMTGPSYAWLRSGTASNHDLEIEIADAGSNSVRLVNRSFGGTYFCVGSIDGAVSFGQSAVHDPDECVGGW